MIKIEENISLAPMTTFRIGGIARFFCRVRSVEDVRGALAYASAQKISFFILGGGSNILLSDKGFDGLVIKNEISGIEELPSKNNDIYIRVGAGENWDIFVGRAVGNGWHGVENLSLIPGTVGAAPVQNIGAYGVEVGESIATVETIDTTTGELRVFSNEQCCFGYRDSFFKNVEGKKYVITHVTFKLTRTCDLALSYKDIQQFYNENPKHPQTLSGVRDAVIAIRTAKLPNLEEYGTAGSFFKNPVIAATAYTELKKKYPDMPSFAAPKKGDVEMVKIPLAWILDNVCGFKGVTRGNVGVYKNQALVLVNFFKNKESGTAQEIRSLSNEIINSVFDKTGIQIEPEVQFVGDFA